jgi:tubulin epsilon
VKRNNQFMGEYITIQVGQCGNQIGSILWPSIIDEYGIMRKPVGPVLNSKLDKSFKSFFHCPDGLPKNCSTITDMIKSKVTARAVLIDMEEKVVERFKHGIMRHLFDKRYKLVNSPGSGNNWAVGHYAHFNYFKETLIDMFQRIVEQCDSLAGFFMMLSLGGGTGSGLGTAIIRLLEEQFPHVDRIVTCVHPGQYNDVVTSPYNIGHSLRILSDYASCVIPVDNKALLDICTRHNFNQGVKPFEDANKIIVNMLLNLTSGSRFSGSLNCDISDLSSLVPQPGLQYFSCSLSPLEIYAQRDLSYQNKRRDLIQEVCTREDQLLRVNALSGKIFTSALLCRGDITISALRDLVHKFQSKVEFTRWSLSGIKTGLCSVPPINQKRSVLCLVNSTNMASVFSDSLKHFNLLYNRKAHVHHYTNVDGFNEDDFLLTKESLVSMSVRYLEAANFVEVPRLQVN